MNATCLNKDGKFKNCPYRVITEEHEAILLEQGNKIIQFFSPCIGEKCIAYHVGIFLEHMNL